MEDNSYISNSKNKLFPLKVIVFAVMLVPLVFFSGRKYAAATTENQVNTYSKGRWNEFYSLEKNSVDILFLGSSHSYCTFDPEIFDQKLGTSSYQLGMPLQHMDSTYYTLLEALNYQTPKLVVVDVYWDMIDDKFELTQAGYLFQVLRNKDLEQQYIRQVFPLGEQLKYRIAVTRYQGDYFAFRTSMLNKKIENKAGVKTPPEEIQEGVEEYRSKGYTYCNYHMLPDEFDKTNQFKGLDGKDWNYEPVQVKYLEKITSLCREKGINVIWTTAPIAPVSLDYIQNYDMINEKITELAKKNQVAYYDYNIINRDKNLLTVENFRDDAHLNHSGVVIVDNDFADTIKKYIE